MTEYKKHRDWSYFIIRDRTGGIQGVKFFKRGCNESFPHWVTFAGNKRAVADFSDLTSCLFFEKYSSRVLAGDTRRRTKKFLDEKREILRLAA